MVKPTQKHIDNAKKILHYPSELELLHKAQELAEKEEEQSAEIERLKGKIAHLREVAAIQHEYEEVCEFYIQCSPTPKGLLEWFGTISKDIP